MKKLLTVTATLVLAISSLQAADRFDSSIEHSNLAIDFNETLVGSTVFTQGEGMPVGLSGSWYDPSNPGHGFMMQEVGPAEGSDSDRLYVIWNTYDRVGNQAWIFGVGEIVGSSVFIDASTAAVVTDGGSFPPTFSESERGLEVFPWGELVFDFSSCNSGEVTFDTGYPGFSASGTISLTRLSKIKGQSCDLEGAELNDMFNMN